MTAIIVFPDLKARQADRVGDSWAAVVEFLRSEPPKASKAACRLFSGALFGEHRTSAGCLRHDDNVEAIAVLTGDHDAGTSTFDEALACLESARVRGCVYPSASSTPEAPRWRVVVPLSKPLTPSVHSRLMNRLNGVLRGVLAGESWTVSQGFYFGPIVGKPFAVVETFNDHDEGEFIDTLDELDAIALGKQVRAADGSSQAAVVGRGAVAALRAKLGRRLCKGDERRDALKSEIASLSVRGMAADGIRSEVECLAADHFDPIDPIDWPDILEMIRHFVERDSSAQASSARVRLPAPVRTAPISHESAGEARGDVVQRGAYAIVPTGRYKGYIATNALQVLTCVSRDPYFPWSMTFDEFLQDILIVRDDKRASLDDSAFAMRAWFDDSGWEPVGNEMIRGAVRTVALQRIENLAATYVTGLIETWDGIDRTEGLLDALGIGSKPYTQAVAQYWITAMAARAMTPGVQADNIVVLKGPQGAGKSRVLRALAPVIEGIQTYREGNLDDLLTEERSARLCRGCLILNLDELRQVGKREAADLKAALSRSHETYVPKWREDRVGFGRTCFLVGTTNADEFLDDSTGNRRYYVLETSPTIDRNWVQSNCEQIWAQGATWVRDGGIRWEAASLLAVNMVSKFEIEDAREAEIVRYAERFNNVPLLMTDVLEQALGVSRGLQTRSLQMLAAAALRRANRRKVKGHRHGGVVANWWLPPD